MRWKIGIITAALCTCALPLAAQQRVELPARDRALELPMRTLFSLGAVDGEEYENFGMVTDVAFDARGNVYVLDAQAYHIVVFDANGTYLRTIGRQGAGPGEFTFPSGIAVMPNGELVVNDGGRTTLHVFAADGTFLRSVPMDEELGRAIGRMRATSRGTVLTETAQLGVPGSHRFEGGRIRMPPRSVTALSVADVASGTRLYNAAPRELNASTERSANGGTFRFSMAVSAFDPQLLWTPHGDGGAAISNQAVYRITLTDASGRPVRYLERALEPRAVTKKDREAWLAQRRERAGSGTMVMSMGRSGGGNAPPPPAVTRVDASDIDEDDVNWGDVVPLIDALGTDSYGRLWVQRSDADLGDGPIDIIDAELRYLGTLPAQAMPRAFGPGGRVAYIERDELDVSHVVVKQFTR